MKLKRDHKLFDQQIKDIFDLYQAEDISSDWTAMSEHLRNSRMDKTIAQKLTERKSSMAPNWDVLSSRLRDVKQRTKQIRIKQLLELCVVLLLVLFFLQRPGTPLSNSENNSDTTKIDQRLLIAKKESPSHSSIAQGTHHENTRDIIASNSSLNTQKKNIFITKDTSTYLSDIAYLKNEQMVLGTRPDEEMSVHTQSDLPEPVTPLDNAWRKEQISKMIANLKAYPKKISIPFYRIPSDLIIATQNSPKKDIEPHSKKMWIVPFVRFNQNRFQYPEAVLLRPDNSIAKEWRDTTTTQIGYNLGVAFVIQQKKWLLEGFYSRTTKTSNIRRSYEIGETYNDIVQWQLASEQFKMYSLGLNVNRIVYAKAKFSFNLVSGVELHTIYSYQPEVRTEPLLIVPLDFVPGPASLKAVKGEAFFDATGNTPLQESYSYFTINMGGGFFYNIQPDISVLFRSFYSYNYLNKAVGRSTAKIHSWNASLGCMIRLHK